MTIPLHDKPSGSGICYWTLSFYANPAKFDTLNYLCETLDNEVLLAFIMNDSERAI